MLDLKERAIEVIQRDHLAEFLRVANMHDTGCFYFALLMSWNHLFPNRIIDREFARDVVDDRPSLGVSPNTVVDEVVRREKQLSMRVTEIGITDYLDETPAEFIEHAGISSNIKVIRESYPVVFTKPRSSAVILWMGNRNTANCRLHYTSTHPSDRFSPEEIAEYHLEYAPVTIYHLEPTMLS